MSTIRGTVDIAIETCKGCDLCVEACPQDSLELSKDVNMKGYHYAVLVKDNCTGCVNCALVCPDAVITVYRATKKSKNSAAERIPIAVVSNVKRNIALTVGDVPEGGISI
jgi:2-oxoglutarate ferredoxin oxidoreductase subunit delta